MPLPHATEDWGELLQLNSVFHTISPARGYHARLMAQDISLQRFTRLYEQHGRRLPQLATVLLVLLSAHLLARLCWALVPLPDAARWQAPVISPAVRPGSRQTDVQALADRHLFGSWQAPAGADGANAPDTRLSLNLLGILAASNSNESRALIGSADGEEKPYAVSDEVVRGVTLQAIFPDRVVLSRGGALETLRLAKDAPIEGTAPTRVSGGSSQLSSIRDQVLSDPGKAAQYVRVQPAMVNGAMKGFRIYPGRERDAFNNLGLRPGDLVTAVNGIQLDDSQKALQTLSELSQASSVNVTIERGGQSQTLNLNFN